MKNLLKQKFIPVNYSRDLRASFQYLKQGSKTIVEYSEEFMTIQARCGLDEEEDVLVKRFFNGLTLDIQDILAFKHFDNVDGIVQHAIKAIRGSQTIKPENLMHLNGLCRRIPQLQDLNRVIHPRKFSPSPTVKIGLHAIIVNNKGIVQRVSKTHPPH